MKFQATVHTEHAAINFKIEAASEAEARQRLEDGVLQYRDGPAKSIEIEELPEPKEQP